MSDSQTPLSPRALRLAALIEDWPRRTIALDELWQLLHTADPASATRSDRRAQLARLLAELADAGLVSPSRAADGSAHPPLPRRITVAAQTQPPPSASATARAIAWRPELAWTVATRLTMGQVEALREINLWLRDRGADTDRVPLRERSLEIFGQEKRLDRLLGSALFDDSRLTLSLLRTYRTHPPLPARRIGGGAVCLVVENEDTFDTLHRLLRDDPGAVGWIAWGAGGAFEASVASIADLDQVTTVRYYGDLDTDGLRIASSAAGRARRDSLPPVLPANGLYTLLLAAGHRQPCSPADGETAAALAEWLGPALAPQAADLLAHGHRIAQEATGLRLLSADGSWRADLDDADCDAGES